MYKDIGMIDSETEKGEQPVHMAAPLKENQICNCSHESIRADSRPLSARMSENGHVTKGIFEHYQNPPQFLG